MPAKEELETLKKSNAENVVDLLRRRWSPRAFDGREVATSDLESVFQGAAWAASSFNEQPWRFFVGKRGDETYEKIFDSLVEFNQTWSKSAPVLILGITKKTFTHNGTPNRFAFHDLGAATANLSLQATALGLHTHAMAGLDADAARKAFNIPDDYEIGAAVALGYLGDAETLPSDMKKSELEPRTRKKLAEFVYSGFEQPAKL